MGKEEGCSCRDGLGIYKGRRSGDVCFCFNKEREQSSVHYSMRLNILIAFDNRPTTHTRRPDDGIMQPSQGIYIDRATVNLIIYLICLPTGLCPRPPAICLPRVCSHGLALCLSPSAAVVLVACLIALVLPARSAAHPGRQI